ncbi:MAG: Ig-like domain-containing protein [Oscillospiraceae bacterium]|nr:Ig-like domain-containing protein [Oscillospiraceae bacterium]
MSEPIGWRKAADKGSVELEMALVGEDGLTAVATRDALIFTNDNGYSDYSLVYNAMLVAESATTRYYLTRGNYNYSEQTTTFQLEHVRLPAGEYKLMISYLESNGTLDTMNVTTKLVVLPKPVVSVTAQDNGLGVGAMSVALPELSYVSALTMDEETIDVEELAAAGGTYAFTELASDDYSLRYLGGEYPEANVVAVASDVTVASVMTEIAPYGMTAAFEDGGDAATLYYKGAKAKIAVAFGEGVEDQRASFKTSNKKVATVDAVGNVTAVAKGTATITVTSADGTMSKELTVTVAPATIKSIKFQTAKLTSSVILETYVHVQPVVQLQITGLPDGVSVPLTLTASGGKGLKFFDPISVYDEDVEPWRTSVSVMVDGTTAGYTVSAEAAEGGHFTVTAECLGKSASCTVDVDGWSNADMELTAKSQFFRAGKALTGWLAFNINNEIITGAAVLKGDLVNNAVFYLDPATKCVVLNGVKKIDKKLYAFEDGCLVVNAQDGHLAAGEKELADGRTVYFAEDGHLLTGWVKVGGANCYFDPNTGAKAQSAWVPAPNGKGMTWVNEDGLPLGNYATGGTTDEVDLTTITNVRFVTLNGDTSNVYVFFNGAVQTGWVYLSKSDGTTISKAKADFMVYCDPSNHGAIWRGSFWIGNKEYRSYLPTSDYPIPGYLPLPKSSGVKGVKYILLRDYTGRAWVVGADGAVVKDAFVSTYTGSEDGFQYVYVDANGNLAVNQWVAVKGKSYYFGANGYLSTEGAATGMEVMLKSGEMEPVLAKLISAKKPTQGYYYYSPNVNGGKKLTSIVLYDESGNAVMVLDKKGKPACDAAAKARVYVNGAELATFACGADGKVFRATGMSSYAYACVTLGGKYYAIDVYGRILLQQGLVYIDRYYYPYGGYNGAGAAAYVGKNGVLARNAFVKVKVDGQTYTVPFGDDGLNRTSYIYMNGSGVNYVAVKGKAYVTTYASTVIPGHYSPSYTYTTSFYPVYKTGKAGFYGNVYVNKDGSVKAGWVKDPYGNRKYQTVYVTQSYGSVTQLTANYNSSMTPLNVYRIGGKLYLFDNYGNSVSGWVQIQGGTIVAANAKGAMMPEGSVGSLNGAFYFDPKTGAAAAGGWKKAPVPVAVGGELSPGAEGPNVYSRTYTQSDGTEGTATAFYLNATSDTAKLYFSADGTLVRSTTRVIGKKLYKFAADGTSTLTEGWLDAAKTQYMLKNGQLAMGRQKIDGQFYYFDASGVKQTAALRKSGAKWYYYDALGVQATPVMGAWSGEIYVGGVSARNLSAVWNKDGSLAKIVYTASGKPAAGESVSFGVWADPETALAEGLNGYVLDAKGLPMTGVVTGFTYDGESYGMAFNADGSRVIAGEGALVAADKGYAVLDGALLRSGDEEALYITDWSMLPEKDRKTMDSLAKLASRMSEPGVRVLLNEDGSVLANAQTADGHFTNRLGVPLDVYSPFFKFGGKWHTVFPDGYALGTLYPPTNVAVNGTVKVKASGELIGFFNADTGAKLNGPYVISSSGLYVKFKSGQLVTGSYTVNAGGPSLSFYADPDLGVDVLY